MGDAVTKSTKILNSSMVSQNIAVVKFQRTKPHLSNPIFLDYEQTFFE